MPGAALQVDQRYRRTYYVQFIQCVEITVAFVIGYEEVMSDTSVCQS